MTEMAETASLVLRGKGGAVLRLEGRTVVLRRAAEERLIPLEAMADVRAQGRAAEIELLGGAEPVVYRIEGVSAAGAAAFAQTVGPLLPVRAGDETPVDGSSLVEVRPLTGAATGRLSGRKAAAAAGALLYAGLLVAVGVLDGWAQAGMLLFGSVLLSVGGLGLCFAGRAVVREWRLERHGITVMADFSHYTDKWRVYAYTTTTGATYTYETTGVQAPRIEVTYDPASPGEATEAGSFLWTAGGILIVAVLLALVVVMGVSLIGTVIAGVLRG
ncbi:hypothetical protein [Streptomyces sp. S.PNR 29]|uniref:hypothetical protein n=1 Tax=Streptomyces sp. S.PNR 29 TaxID=2973805 RepID=UPI0025B2713A|nr:hypothetical protein [Streptomyces sp. S.PNR 29]MDN0194008.1 hypothetical protein [Streptomyces sp. S.PNR 29]